MDFVDFGIIALAGLMVWLFYKATQETRAFGSGQRKFGLRQVRAQNRGEEHIGGIRTRR